MEVAELKVLRFFARSDKHGQDQESVNQTDSAGGTVWRENTRGKIEVVCPCPQQIFNRVKYSTLWILCHILVG